MLGTQGTGTLTTQASVRRLHPVPVSYVLIEGVPYVRMPHRSEVLEHISQDSRVSLHMCPHDADGALIQGDAEVAEGFEHAARLVSAFDQRFSDLLPPPLPDDVTSTDGSTSILRISPAADPED